MDTKALRQKILDLAIRGKLVPQDSNDEPASVLLEKIREQKKQMVKEGKLKAKDIKNDTIIFVGEDNLHYEKFQDGTMKCIEDEIPFELPEGWSWTRIGTIAVFIGGYAYKSNRYVPNSHNLLIRIGNIKNNSINPFVAKTCISDEYASETSGYLIRENDILFTMTGTRGKRDYFFSCRIDRTDLTGLKLFLNQRVGCLRLINTTSIHPSYLVNAIQSSCVLDAIFATETGNVNQGNIGSTATMNLLVPIPPSNEQNIIQEKILSSLNAIEQYNIDSEKLLEVIQTTRAKILDLAIRGKLVPQDPNDEPASVLLEHIHAEKEELIKQGKIKRDKKESFIFKGDDNSYYDDIPSGWSRILLKDVCEVINGFAFKSTDFSRNGTPIIRISDIKNGIISTEDCVYWNQELDKRFVIKKGDLLIAMSGATTGKMGVYENDSPAYLNQRVGNVRIKDSTIICAEYRDIYLQGMQDIILKNAYGGAQPNISSKFIEEMLFLLPPYNEQLRIVSKVKMLFNILNKMEKSFI